MVAPKRNVTKLTQERFKALTGWQNRQMSMDVMAQCWFMAFSILFTVKYVSVKRIFSIFAI